MARHEGPLVSIDVSAMTDPDCGTVEELARVRLTARRLGYEVELRNVPTELHELLDLAGLCKVVGCSSERRR